LPKEAISVKIKNHIQKEKLMKKNEGKGVLAMSPMEAAYMKLNQIISAREDVLQRNFYTVPV